LFWGEQPPLHTVGVGGGNFLITKSDALGSLYHSRPKGSESEIRSFHKAFPRYFVIHRANGDTVRGQIVAP